jgi:hypothetical protein
MALGAATLTAACGGTTTTEADGGARDTQGDTVASDTANAATDATGADDAGIDTALPPEDSIAKPYGAPPFDGYLA